MSSRGFVLRTPCRCPFAEAIEFGGNLRSALAVRPGKESRSGCRNEGAVGRVTEAGVVTCYEVRLEALDVCRCEGISCIEIDHPQASREIAYTVKYKRTGFFNDVDGLCCVDHRKAAAT